MPTRRLKRVNIHSLILDRWSNSSNKGRKNHTTNLALFYVRKVMLIGNILTPTNEKGNKSSTRRTKGKT